MKRTARKPDELPACPFCLEHDGRAVELFKRVPARRLAPYLVEYDLVCRRCRKRFTGMLRLTFAGIADAAGLSLADVRAALEEGLDPCSLADAAGELAREEGGAGAPGEPGAPAGESSPVPPESRR